MAPSRGRAWRAPASAATPAASLRGGAGSGVGLRFQLGLGGAGLAPAGRPARSPPSLAPPRALTRPGRCFRGSAGRSARVAAAAAGAGSSGDGSLGFVWLGGVPTTDGLRWPRRGPALGQAEEDVLDGERAGSSGVPAAGRAACSRHARGRAAREAEYIHREVGGAVIPRPGAAFARANPVASPVFRELIPSHGGGQAPSSGYPGLCWEPGTLRSTTSRAGGKGRNQEPTF